MNIRYCIMDIHHCINNINIIEFEKSNIFLFDNILDNDTCDKLIVMIETVKKRKLSIYHGNNVECYITHLGTLLKTNDELYYPFSVDEQEYKQFMENIKKKNIYTNKLNGLMVIEIKKISDLIFTKLKEVYKCIEKINPSLNIDTISGIIFRKIYGETLLHTDGINDDQFKYSDLHFIKENKINEKVLACSITNIFNLNDNYQGGEFNFPYYNVSIKLKKGSLIIFPPYWTHWHSVNIVKNNTYRYTLSNWGLEYIK